MQALCDANLLLALVYDWHAHHTVAVAWLEHRASQEAVVCRVAQMALLRLLSNSTVMASDVCTHSRAWEIWDRVMNDARFLFMQEPPTIEPALRQYSHADAPSPKLWQDAYLAAFSRGAGIALATFDRGFWRFPNLQLELLS